MDLKNISELNTDRFLDEAYDSQQREKLIGAARFYRNIYLVLFLVGFICIFITGFSDRLILSVLSLGLSTLSLVVMTKYDTQRFFLKIIAEKESITHQACEGSGCL